jgi:hypothetical protein
MTAEQPPGAPLDAEGVLGTIDLSGGPEETPVEAVGRVAGGLLLMLIGGVVALGLFAMYLIGGFLPAFVDWHDILGEGLLYAAIIAFVLAVTGFEIMRRSRKKRRAAAALEAADLVGRLANAGVYDGTATPGSIQQALAEGAEAGGDRTTAPTKPPLAGPTIL